MSNVMRLSDLARFFFGPGRSWEHRLILARIALTIVAIASLLACLESSWSRYAAPFAWLFFLVFLASVVYQFRRRWKELKCRDAKEQ